MGYRTLTVNVKDYQYTTGRKNTKIVGVGIFENKDYGSLFAGCGKSEIAVITPKHVRNMILGIKEPVVYHCKRHNHSTTRLATNPFAAEIYGKTILVKDCPKCLEELGNDI
jgi:hypothetical protein